MNSQIQWPGFTIEVTQDWLDVSSMFEPDPNWRYIDAKGHGHYYHSDKTPYPTLKWRKNMVTDEDGEKWDAGWYQCPRCRERIKPGIRSGEGRKIPGLRHITLIIDGQGVPITKAEQDAILGAAEAKARELWESRRSKW